MELRLDITKDQDENIECSGCQSHIHALTVYLKIDSLPEAIHLCPNCIGKILLYTHLEFYCKTCKDYKDVKLNPMVYGSEFHVYCLTCKTTITDFRPKPPNAGITFFL